MDKQFKKICKINDDRLSSYVKRMRSGITQVFHTGNDQRDFDRYRKEGGGSKHNVTMHDKKDTIRLDPPEKHYFAELIDGEWWWINGCAECNGGPRDWMTYIECTKHNVCRTCKTPRAEIKDVPWGGKHGWECKPCADSAHEEAKKEALQSVADKEYDEFDYLSNDEIICPYCDSKMCSDDFHESNDVECEVCDNTFNVEVEHTASYTTKRKGEGVTL
jgi:hypothetical protein